MKLKVKKYKEINSGKPLALIKLRHSFASEWLRSGGNLVLLRDQLGHNSIETTSLYTNLSSEDARKVIEKMENSENI
ncbi:tyrosine-type recombinase/integrase [Bacillus sp. FJAT-47783]|uniref:tyrosine-type recombinase/integrase n=1 Tax=Bacillus sp. FJAT-47783 TaxID=2922712 RepID=UPI001FAE55F1|nr:tyrosine-type recombinase/integrase [Bacillus sp. FJAT-47783]